MGGQQSTTVSILAEGEQESPFSIRRHPNHPKEVLQNPKEFPTMKELTLDNFKKYKNLPYLGIRPKDGEKFLTKYEFTTYEEGFNVANQLGSGLFNLGVRPGTTIGVYAENNPQWLNTIDASCLYGFVIVSLYDSLGLDSLAYLLEHSQMETVVISARNVSKVAPILSKNSFQIKHLIVIGENLPSNLPEITTGQVKYLSFGEVCQIGKNKHIEYPKFLPEDPHFICYSSGTTGNPKGVIISHRATVSNTIGADLMIQVGEGARHLSYLPLAHVFERAAVAITARSGGQIGFNSGGVLTIKEDMGILKPTYFVAVPRVINRFYDVINTNLKASAVKRNIFWGAWYAKKFCLNWSLPTCLFDAVVFNQIKKSMGGCVEQFIVGGAAMDAKIHEIMQVATGVPLRSGYGLTEAGSGNVCNPYHVNYSKPGTVGGPLENVEVRLEPIDGYDDPECGQILVGGTCLCSGYLNDPEATKNLFVDDSRQWIKTGDVGKWDKDGYLMIVDRMRSIFKLSQGEYVAAEILTQIYDSVDLVAQFFVYGDSSRTCLVAIIVPSLPDVAKFLGKNNLSEQEFIQACKSHELKKEIQKRCDEMAKREKLFGYQFIRNIYLDNDSWTIENELLTPTFKLKRKKLETKYKPIIEDLYKSLDDK